MSTGEELWIRSCTHFGVSVSRNESPNRNPSPVVVVADVEVSRAMMAGSCCPQDGELVVRHRTARCNDDSYWIAVFGVFTHTSPRIAHRNLDLNKCRLRPTSSYRTPTNGSPLVSTNPFLS